MKKARPTIPSEVGQFARIQANVARIAADRKKEKAQAKAKQRKAKQRKAIPEPASVLYGQTLPLPTPPPVFELQNALIKATMLGIEDHGILSFMIHLDFGGTGQGYGGWCLDDLDPTDKHHRIQTPMTGELVQGVITVIGVTKWEDLPGKHCRIKRAAGYHGTILAIGHFMKDQWFSFQSVADAYIAKQALSIERGGAGA